MSEFVDEIIKTHKVAVFSKSSCPFCVKAKNILKKYDIKDIYIVELDTRDDAGKIQDYLSKITGARTVSGIKIETIILMTYLWFIFKVPRVFIGGKCIGGGDETAKLERDNKLKPALEACAAI